MSFDTLPIYLFIFLCLFSVLSSLPADPYYHSWQSDPESYGTTHGSYDPKMVQRGDPRIRNPYYPTFSQANYTERRVDLNFPERQSYVSSNGHTEWWQQVNTRSQSSQNHPQDFSVFPRSDLTRNGHILNRRISDEFVDSGGENLENNNKGYGGELYSSHVNCQEPNQNKENTQKTPREVDGNGPALENDQLENGGEKINFEESSRNYRSGTSSDSDNFDPRIVTPKGSSRRPTQGNSGKNPNKTFPGATNTFSTTEKTFRNQTQKGSKRTRPNISKPQGGEIVFPDGYRRQKFTPRITKCGKKSTFCEHVGEDYPSEYITQVLRREGAMFREFFGKDMISDPNITERIHAPEENSLCPFRQEVVFPRAAQNKEDKWLFIVNQDQYVQGVTVEVCLNPESRCILTEGFPLGYTPYCKQKYIERRLVAIGEDGKPHSDSFRLPSCCSCVVKHETSARMSLSRTSSRTSGDSS